MPTAEAVPRQVYPAEVNSTQLFHQGKLHIAVDDGDKATVELL
jgi:hypothetical protein